MTTSITEVQIFYSSKNNPRIIDRYQEVITYLREEGVDAKIIDIAENPQPARNHDIVTTPTILINRNGEMERHLGVITGLVDVLQDDAYGRSVLHQTGFRAGRDAARSAGVEEDASRAAVEDLLADVFDGEGVTVELETYNPSEPRVEVMLTPRADASHTHADESAGIVHEQFGAYLGGVFTEVFGQGMETEETTCVQEGDNHCSFTVTAGD